MVGRARRVNTTGNHVLLTGTGTQIALMPAEEGAQSAHTVLNFEIENIFEQIKHLEIHGVSFFDYDLPALKTTDHVAVMGSEKAVWSPTRKPTTSACTRTRRAQRTEW